MTTVISRLFDSAQAAHAVADELAAIGFPEGTVDVIRQTGDSSTVERILQVRVGEETAQLFSQHLTTERALLVVRAPFYPLGAARKAQDVVASYAHIDLGDGVGDEYIREEPETGSTQKILRNRRFLTAETPDRRARSMSELFNLPVLATRRTRRSLVASGPISTGAFPFQLLLTQARPRSVARRGGPVLSRAFRLPTLSRPR